MKKAISCLHGSLLKRRFLVAGVGRLTSICVRTILLLAVFVVPVFVHTGVVRAYNTFPGLTDRAFLSTVIGSGEALNRSSLYMEEAHYHGPCVAICNVPAYNAFTGVMPYAAPSPVLSYPTSGSTVTGTSINFQWGASTGATGYWLTAQKISDGTYIINIM